MNEPQRVIVFQVLAIQVPQLAQARIVAHTSAEARSTEASAVLIAVLESQTLSVHTICVILAIFV